MMRACRAPRARAGGFTLQELTVVVVTLALAATVAVPRWMQSSERAIVSEAARAGAAVAAAQDAHHQRTGRYAATFAELGADLGLARLRHFTVSSLSLAADGRGWEIQFTRSGSAGGYGSYRLAYDQGGFNPERSSVPPELAPLD